MWSKSGGREANIPANPDENYAHDGWQSYGHWLGTGNLVGGKLAFLPFKKALVYARTLKLKSLKEWKDWAKTGVRPGNMPSTPDKHYKHDGVARVRALAGHRHSSSQRLAVSAFQEGAAVTLRSSLQLKNIMWRLYIYIFIHRCNRLCRGRWSISDLKKNPFLAHNDRSFCPHHLCRRPPSAST